MEKVIQIEISKINPHPEQEKVYSSELDFRFVESIRTVGILQPVLLAKGEVVDGKIVLNDDADSYIAVSGHRRIKAAKEIGLATVPAIIKAYLDPILVDLDFIESNRNREKNDTEKKLEFGLCYQILSQITKYKINKGDKFDLKNDLDAVNRGVGTTSRGSEIWQNIEEFLKKIGVDIYKPLNIRTALALATGLPEREIRKKMKLEHDYWANKTEKWERVLKYADLEKCYKQYYEVMTKYRNNEITEEEALSQVEKLINKIEGMYEKELSKGEQKVKKKEKVYLSLPITKNPNYEFESKVFEDELKHNYIVINPVKVAKQLREDFGRELEWIEYMEKLILKMKECKYYAPRGKDNMRKESNGCRIEDIVATILDMKWI